MRSKQDCSLLCNLLDFEQEPLCYDSRYMLSAHASLLSLRALSGVCLHACRCVDLPRNASARPRSSSGSAPPQRCDDDILFERDTPYVPTPQDVVERMLDMVNVKPGEFLIDLGSGDGRIASPRRSAARAPMASTSIPSSSRRASPTPPRPASATAPPSRCKDLFETDISKADVLTIYLLPLVNLDLRPRLLEQMRPGARLVAHAFHMGDVVAGRHRQHPRPRAVLLDDPGEGRRTLAGRERGRQFRARHRPDVPELHAPTRMSSGARCRS